MDKTNRFEGLIYMEVIFRDSVDFSSTLEKNKDRSASRKQSYFWIEMAGVWRDAMSVDVMVYEDKLRTIKPRTEKIYNDAIASLQRSIAELEVLGIEH